MGKIEGSNFWQMSKKIVLANIILPFQHLKHTHYTQHSFQHAKFGEQSAFAKFTKLYSLQYFLLYGRSHMIPHVVSLYHIPLLICEYTQTALGRQP